MAENNGAEEVLRRILLKLEELSNRIGRIEAYLSSIGVNQDMLRISLQLTAVTSASLANTLEYAMRAWKVIEGLSGLCPISRSIITSLSDCSELSISDIYRRVKKLRGAASRRIISERIKLLESKGAVINVGTEARPKYILKICRQRERENDSS